MLFILKIVNRQFRKHARFQVPIRIHESYHVIVLTSVHSRLQSHAFITGSVDQYPRLSRTIQRNRKIINQHKCYPKTHQNHRCHEKINHGTSKKVLPEQPRTGHEDHSCQ